MISFLSIFIIVISILAIFINQWITFIPQLGITFQYHRRRVQIAIAFITIFTASVLCVLHPTTSQFITLGLVILLTPFSGFNHARRFLVVVDRPQQVIAASANWDDQSLVIGYVDQTNNACAWLIETLIPHHLINDTVNKEPVLVAW